MDSLIQANSLIAESLSGSKSELKELKTDFTELKTELKTNFTES